MPRILVVGSANVDFTVALARLPGPGETVTDGTLLVARGGKGANQAVAAALAGAPTSFVGSVGDDPGGGRLRRALAGAGVAIEELVTVEAPTGRAFVLVADDGGNAIVVVAGANSALSPAHVERALAAAGPLDVVVVQCEIAPATVARTIEVAAAAGARAVLNLAPFVALDRRVLEQASLLVVNESEASALLGEEVPPAEAVAAIRDRFGIDCIATMGAAGSVLAGRDGGASTAPAPAVPVVDTTGAGDVYVGVVAAALVTGADLPLAMATATAAAGIAVGRLGAQASFPTRDEILAHLR